MITLEQAQQITNHSIEYMLEKTIREKADGQHTQFSWVYRDEALSKEVVALAQRWRFHAFVEPHEDSWIITVGWGKYPPLTGRI